MQYSLQALKASRPATGRSFGGLELGHQGLESVQISQRVYVKKAGWIIHLDPMDICGMRPDDFPGADITIER